MWSQTQSPLARQELYCGPQFKLVENRKVSFDSATTLSLWQKKKVVNSAEGKVMIDPKPPYLAISFWHSVIRGERRCGWCMYHISLRPISKLEWQESFLDWWALAQRIKKFTQGHLVHKRQNQNMNQGLVISKTHVLSTKWPCQAAKLDIRKYESLKDTGHNQFICKNSSKGEKKEGGRGRSIMPCYIFSDGQREQHNHL